MLFDVFIHLFRESQQNTEIVSVDETENFFMLQQVVHIVNVMLIEVWEMLQST